MAQRADVLVRKTVTVLFCDVTGFTSLGERVDPETMRRVMLRYFDEMRGVLERHGGTVEKFIGDAVMAVFGVPVVHEDDALRAVRAADEMRQALARLNDDLEERYGLRLEERIGINTGEVVVGGTSGQTVATGDAINVAARLQQAASPGEILLGHETYRLIGERVRAGPLETFSLKGKREEVSTWRLDEVRAGAEQMFRRLDSPLVGRRGEQDTLHTLYREALDEQTWRLVTVVGAAGIGKTRLAQEVAARLFGATVAQGRCLPYGDGITFFPVTEIVRSLAGVSADDEPDVVHGRIAQLLPPGDESALVADRLAELLAADTDVPAEEAFWAVRKLLEAVARSRPLVLVLEDLHWAEPSLLDLVEYLVGWARGASMLVVCLTRPELLETRPSWPGERIALEPLASGEVRALLANLLGAAELDANVARRIESAADGNPLFVEELTRMLIEDGTLVLESGRWVARDLTDFAIPPSIGALLAARLDRLDPDERTVLQCASVIGKQFWWSAVVELAPAQLRERVGAHLHALVRKRLIFPAESTSFVSEDSLRFGHILVRDAAYASLPKERRAELHERLAEWLDRKGAYEEIRGHHLDRAYVARRELGPVGEETRALGERAGSLLASAGRRAFSREDMPAAARLLERAAALLPDGDLRREAMREQSAALWVLGDQGRAGAILDEVLGAAVAAEDRTTEWSARLDRAGRGGDAGDLESTAREALSVFTASGDDLGVARAARRLAAAANRRCAFGEAQVEGELALSHAQAAGSRQEQARAADALCTALFYGPMPAADGLVRCRELLPAAEGNLLMEANVLCSLAGLQALRDDLAGARASYQRSRLLYEELGLELLVAALSAMSGWIELLAGNPAAAEDELRQGIELFGDRFEDAVAHRAALLALALLQQSRRDEAVRTLERPVPVGRAPRIVFLLASARVGADGEAAQEAVALAAETDALNLQADAHAAVADLLGDAGARSAALDLYERKGNVVSARSLRSLAQV